MSATAAFAGIALSCVQPEPASAGFDAPPPAASTTVLTQDNRPTPPVPALPPVVTPEPEPAKSPDDILVTGRQSIPGDPLAEVNAASYEVVQEVDRAVVRPAALAYRAVVPLQGRNGVRNFLSNLAEPVVFLNFVLQLKFGKAAQSAGRFGINSTIGVAGVFDMAKRKPFSLPKRVNGFANTLGYYGVKPGPFLFLPIVGPTTMRDLVGLGIDRLIVPVAVGKPFNRPYYAIPAGVLTSLDQRAEADDKLAKLHDETGNAYVATREDYLQRRQAEIDALRGLSNDGQTPVASPN